MGLQVFGGASLKLAFIEPLVLHSDAAPSRKVSFFHFKTPSDNCQVVEMGLAGLDGMKSCDLAPVVVENTAPLDVTSCPLESR